jgi:hypothetical protein
MTLDGFRRSRSGYPLQARCYGKTSRDRRETYRLRSLITTVGPNLGMLPAPIRPAMAMYLHLLIRQYRRINGWISIPEFRFFNRHRFAHTFSDGDLYNMRITDRNHIPKLIAVLFPAGHRFECDNGCVEDCEVGLLMWFYWTSFPRHIFTMQKLFGRECSKKLFGADNDHILQVGMGTLTTFHPTIILFVPIL